MDKVDIKVQEAIKEKAIAACWEMGNLRYKIRDYQLEIYDKNKAAIKNANIDLFCNNISRQHGKTFCTSVIAIELAVTQPNSNIQFYAPSAKDLKERIHPVFRTILEDCPEHLKPEFRSLSQNYSFPNGSSITFHGVNNDRADSIRGGAIHLAIIDEAGWIDELEYLISSIIIPAFLQTRGTALITSTPPDSASHPYVEVYKECKRVGTLLHRTIYDDKSVSPEQLEKIIRGYKGGVLNIDFRREFLAELVTSTTFAVIKNWNKQFILDEHELSDGTWTTKYIDHPEFYQYYFKVISIDYGIEDYTAVNFYVYDFEKAKLIQEAELWLNGPTLTTDFLASEITRVSTELWGEKAKPYRITCDTSDKFVTQTLRISHGISARPVSKSSLKAMVNKMNLFLGGDNFRVHPRCKMSIACYEDAVWKKDRQTGGIDDSKWAHSKYLGHYDSAASLMYQICSMGDIETRNPVPQKMGFAAQIRIPIPETKQKQTIAGILVKSNPVYKQEQRAKRIFSGHSYF